MALARMLLVPFMLAGTRTASADTLQVGPTRPYVTVRSAILAAEDGDVIEIDAGTYKGDVATITANDLTIRGIGGFAHLDAGNAHEGGKGTWVVVGDNLVVQDVEFSNASVPDQNGAGIRLEGDNLTVQRCLFHDNENGILAGDNAASDIRIEDSEFHHNGFGDGYTHNVYVNHVRSLVVRGSYFHHARVGHELKSRALTTLLYANRFMNGTNGTASYEIDLPNGGLAILIGNVIQQAGTTMNSTMLSFAAEGASNPMQALYVVHNTFVNDRASGGTFIRTGSTPAAVVTNNLFVGTGTLVDGEATMTSNLQTSDPVFVSRANFDYRLAEGSAPIDMGTDPGSAGTTPLLPSLHYRDPTGTAPRTMVGAALDLGAFEFGIAPEPADGGMAPTRPPDCTCQAHRCGTPTASVFICAVFAIGLIAYRLRRR